MRYSHSAGSNYMLTLAITMLDAKDGIIQIGQQS